jgi:hypothetical protein
LLLFFSRNGLHAGVGTKTNSAGESLMPARGLKLLVGLTHIDTESSFYKKRRPGFDGRAGAWGCERDVEMIDRISHYCGFESVLGRPLINEKATRARVLAALESAADPSSGLSEGDIFLLYFSCHGETLGEGPVTNISSPVGNAINQFLLYDRPILNIDLLPRLTAMVLRGLRVVTIFDCCHAGMGTNLSVPELESIGATINFLIEYLGRLGIALPIQITSVPTPQLLLAAIANLQPTLRTQILNVLGDRLAAAPKTPALFHMGAARDFGKALGGENGSLFTRTLTRLFKDGGNALTYAEFGNALSEMLPPKRQPAIELWDTGLGHLAPGTSRTSSDHFAFTARVFEL